MLKILKLLLKIKIDIIIEINPGKPEQCCDTIELRLNDRKSFNTQGNPNGNYVKQEKIWNDRVVYYNNENNFFLHYGTMNQAWEVGTKV